MKPGEKVTYIPFIGCSPSLYEKGIVKSLSEHDSDSVFVVYKCGEEWSNYMNYTAALTPLRMLKKGWKEEEVCDHYFISKGRDMVGRICQDCGEERSF